MATATERLKWLSATFVNGELESEFQRGLQARARRILPAVLGILSLFLGSLFLELRRLVALVMVSTTLVFALGFLVFLLAAPGPLQERHFAPLLHIAIWLVAGSVTTLGLTGIVAEQERLAPGFECGDDIECNLAITDFQFFVVANCAVLSALPFVSPLTFCLVSLTEAATYDAAVLLYTPHRAMFATLVTLVVVVFSVTVYARARQMRLEFLFKRHLEGTIHISVQRETLFGWVRGEVGPAAAASKPNWLIDAKDIEVGELLGSGASGKVYLASWSGGVKVAVKEMHSAANELDRFADEIALLSSLRHPNVLMFLGVVVNDLDKSILLVTEYCDRGSLANLVIRQRLSAGQTMGLMEGAARGMQYLHSNDPPILHRDLKPHNLLVDNHLRVKVADLGIAGLQEDDEALEVCGTLVYVAPEILARREPPSVATDVYSFGVTMWEVAAGGEEPYQDLIQSTSLHAVSVAVAQRQERPQLAAMHASLPPEYVELVQRCWSQNAAQRPSFTEVVAILSDLDDQDSSFSPTTGIEDALLLNTTGFLVRAEIAHADALWVDAPLEMHDVSLAVCAAFRRIVGAGAILDLLPGAVLVTFQAAEPMLDFVRAIPAEIKMIPLGNAISGHPFGLEMLTVVDFGEIGRRKDGAAVVRVGKLTQMLARESGLRLITQSARLKCAEALRGLGLVTRPIELPEELVDEPLFRLGREEEFGSQDGWALPNLSVGETTLLVDYPRLHLGKQMARNVWRARHRGDPVVVKLFDTKPGADAPMAAELLQEAALARAMVHPFVARYHGVSVRPLAVVMERFVGSVESLVAEHGVVAVDKQHRILRGVATAMAFLHGRAVQHRNLKASNILLREDGTPAVADFGQARVRATTATMTGLSAAAHMAPEALHGKSSPKSDVWSFGVVVWQLDCGKLDVFHQRRLGIVEVVSGIISGDLVPTCDNNPLVQRCCRWDPKERPDFDVLAAEAEAGGW